MKESKFEKIARIISRQYNIRVVFGGNMAYTDGKIINLPFLDDITNENITSNLDGYLDHEVAHCLFTDFSQLEYIKNEYHKTLLNFTEDIRIEREMMKKYSGTKFHILPLREWVENKTLKTFNDVPWPMKFCFELQLHMKGELKAPHKETEKYFDLCKKEINELNSATSTKEIREITEEILKKLIEAVDKDELEKGNQPQQPQNNGQGNGNSDGDSQDSGESQDESQGSPKSVKNDENGSSGSNSVKQDNNGDAQSNQAKKLAKDILNGNKNEIEKYSKDIHDFINEEFDKEFEGNPSRYTVNTTEHDEEHKSKQNAYTKSSYKTFKKSTSSIAKKMANKLERVLKAKSRSRWSGDKERGTVNPKKISTVLCDKNNKRVFRDFENEETNKVSVSLLVDLSGSMSGSKINNAKLTATALSESLKILNIDHEILGFTTSSDYRSVDPSEVATTRAVPLKHTIFKSFSDDDSSGIALMRAESTNADGESVLWAAKRLGQTKKERKILFVLSDGLPNVLGEKRNEATLREHLKDSVKKIEKSGIEVVAFGIESNAVKNFYNNHVIVNKVEELTTSVVNELIKILK